MARKGIGFRRTLRDQRLESLAGQSFYAAMMTDPERRAEQEQRIAAERAAIAPKRERGPSEAPELLEAAILNAILDLLHYHPRTLLVVRQNSGSASYQTKDGKWAPVKFYDFCKRPEKMRIPDVWGLLTDGRFFAVEAKKAGWSGPGTTASATHVREREQAAFLRMVRSAGGIGIFACSVDDVEKALR